MRYFVAVARERNVTRAAEHLHLSQPALSAAVKQLERAGEVFDDVRARGGAPSGRLQVGLSPTARYGVGPELLTACATSAPAVMLYTREDTTRAPLRDVAGGRLDLAVVFCADTPPPAGVELTALRDERAVVHLPAGHALAGRDAVTLADLECEEVLVAAGRDSGGFTDRVLAAFAAAGVRPRTRPDPYPDLGLQAVREGVGVVVYVRSAFPPELAGSAFVTLEPPVSLPFQLAWRASRSTAAVTAVLDAARTLADAQM